MYRWSGIGPAALRVCLGIGRRGVFLLFIALLDVIIAYNLTQPLPLHLPERFVYGPMMDLAPIAVWAWWWTLTGILALVAALWPRARVMAFTAASLIKVAWATCYLSGWLEHLPLFNRGYSTAAIFYAFAGFVVVVSGWRENGT